MKRNYNTIASSGKANERQLTDFLSRNGQFLLPMMELIEQSRMAVEELIDVAGRVTIEAVLRLSARLRRKSKGNGKEVAVPAYVAMQDRAGMGARMLDLLMRGVSTRQ